jgi:hypothetical protein
MQISNCKLIVVGEAKVQFAFFDLQFAIKTNETDVQPAGLAPSALPQSLSAFGAC